MSDSDSEDRSSAFTSDSVPDEYERHLVPAVFEPWAEVLLDAVVIAPGSRVLDIASGTGVVARAAARPRRWRRSRGGQRRERADAGALGRRRSRRDGAAPIEYREASADALPFEDGCL